MSGGGPDWEKDLLALRAEFPTLERGVHLISHSLGAMPRGARRYSQEYLDNWETESIRAWAGWFPSSRALGDVIAQVLGVQKGTIVMLPNVTFAQAIIASAFDFKGPRNKIVYDDLNFTTVHYVWREQARRGAEICVVKSDDGVHPPTERLIAAIDEKTLLVPISHVLFRSSGLYDAKRVIDHAHRMGAMVFLDCYQSAGIVPLALEEWGCDMACGGSVKWACGGPGAAYLYVRPDLVDNLRPSLTGWISHEEPFAFDMEGPMRYAPGIKRMQCGTPAIPAIYTARAGWEMIAKIGVDRVRAKSLRQTALLRDLVLDRGCTVNTPEADEERGGTICFDFPKAMDVSDALVQRGFFHDYRPTTGLRVSPHFFTTDDELRAFVAALDEVRRKGAPPSTAPRAY